MKRQRVLVILGVSLWLVFGLTPLMRSVQANDATAEAAHQPNSDVNNPVRIANLPFDYSETLFGSGGVATSSCGRAFPAALSTWFVYTPATSQRLQIDAFSSGLPMRAVAVFTRDSSLHEVACQLVSLDMPLSAGQTYYIEVAAMSLPIPAPIQFPTVIGVHVAPWVGHVFLPAVVKDSTWVPLPAAPSNLTATATSATTVHLSWRDNSDNETGFRVIEQVGGRVTEIGTVGRGVTAWDVTALAPMTDYTFWVRAFSAGGDSALSNSAPVRTLESPPAAPSNLRLVSLGATTVELAWEDNSNNEQGFRIEESFDGQQWIELEPPLGPNATSDTITNLTPGYNNIFRVKAFNAGGGSYSNQVTVTLPGRWVDGPAESSMTLNCMILGAPYPEPLGLAWVSYYGEPGVTPRVGEVYFARAAWAITGLPCGNGGSQVHVEFFLPPNTSLAISPSTPVRCFFDNDPNSGLSWGEFVQGCPQQASPGLKEGGLAFNSTGEAGTWPTATGRAFQMWIPLVSSGPVIGQELRAALWELDGNSNPWVYPHVPLLVNGR